jgi:hypothetical protein
MKSNLIWSVWSSAIGFVLATAVFVLADKIPKAALIPGFVYPLCFAIVITINAYRNLKKPRTIADVHADLRSIEPRTLYLGWDGDEVVMGLSTTRNGEPCVEEMVLSEFKPHSRTSDLLSEAKNIMLRNDL